MIGAGKLNKVVHILLLKKEKDAFGSEKNRWYEACELKAAVYGFDRDSFFKVNAENLISDRLQFIFRGHLTNFFRRDPMGFRIKYKCKKYKVLNVNAEIDGQVSVLTELINE